MNSLAKNIIWVAILVALIGMAMFLSSHRVGAGGVIPAVFKIGGLLLAVVGIFSAIVWSTRYEQHDLPISASIWVAINRAEQIELNMDIDYAMIEDILHDINDYKVANRLEYPPILQDRILALKEKLKKK